MPFICFFMTGQKTLKGLFLWGGSKGTGLGLPLESKYGFPLTVNPNIILCAEFLTSFLSPKC